MHRTYPVVKEIKLKRWVGILLLLTLFFVESSFADKGRHHLWGDLLEKFVTDGVVDYQGFKKEEQQLDRYLEELDRMNPELLSRNEELALYINAYNACTIKLILDNFKDDQPVTSIKKIGGFFSGPWDMMFCRVGGRIYTLDDIEHDIIRPSFKEPRVHFAINCASKSCPLLSSVPYEGDTLDQQLTHNTVVFLGNPQRNYFHGGTLYVSKIFKWFEEDFNDRVVPFFLKYTEGRLKEELSGFSGNIRLEYLDYDWSLNDR